MTEWPLSRSPSSVLSTLGSSMAALSLAFSYFNGGLGGFRNKKKIAATKQRSVKKIHRIL
jgi:hypothetical protein